MTRVLLPALALLLGVAMILAAGTPRSAHPAAGADAAQSDTTRPLQLIMVALVQDMNRIADGIWYEDFEMIRAGAQSIADHPRVPPAQMRVIQETLGDPFTSFVAMDQMVHDTALEVAEAARQRNLQQVLRAQGRLQGGCVACHSAYRDTVQQALYGAGVR